MAALLLGLSCEGLAAGKPAKAASKQADPETIKLVEFFVQAPVADLPPEAVPYFMEVDTGALPTRLLHRYLAKRVELQSLKRLAEGKGKGSLRRLGQDPQTTCGDPDILTPQALGLLRKMGFNEYKDTEVSFLMKETSCTQCELRSEFTLTVIQLQAKPGRKRPAVRFLFRDDDPIIALLAHYYSGTRPRNTSFFGIGGSPKCRY
ncbi:MAG: hypothetical protein HY748_04630 [Elusimicrobia bacterium]|nr:hypothetical protein [Elusimicrobiota bacterium]